MVGNTILKIKLLNSDKQQSILHCLTFNTYVFSIQNTYTKIYCFINLIKSPPIKNCQFLSFTLCQLYCLQKKNKVNFQKINVFIN